MGIYYISNSLKGTCDKHFQKTERLVTSSGCGFIKKEFNEVKTNFLKLLSF